MGKIYLLFSGMVVLFLGTLAAPRLDGMILEQRAVRLEAKNAEAQFENALAEKARIEMLMAGAIAKAAQDNVHKDPIAKTAK